MSRPRPRGTVPSRRPLVMLSKGRPFDSVPDVDKNPPPPIETKSPTVTLYLSDKCIHSHEAILCAESIGIETHRHFIEVDGIPPWLKGTPALVDSDNRLFYGDDVFLWLEQAPPTVKGSGPTAPSRAPFLCPPDEDEEQCAGQGMDLQLAYTPVEEPELTAEQIAEMNMSVDQLMQKRLQSRR